METTEELIEELPPSAKVRAAAALSRFGTRAQKRAVAAGQATKRGAIKVAHGIKNQIMEPYTTAKMLACLALIGGAIALQFYVTYLIAVAVAVATGSIWLVFGAALLSSFAMQMGLTAPVARLCGQYASNKELHESWGSLGTTRTREGVPIVEFDAEMLKGLWTIPNT